MRKLHQKHKPVLSQMALKTIPGIGPVVISWNGRPSPVSEGNSRKPIHLIHYRQVLQANASFQQQGRHRQFSQTYFKNIVSSHSEPSSCFYQTTFRNSWANSFHPPVNILELTTWKQRRILRRLTIKLNDFQKQLLHPSDTSRLTIKKLGHVHPASDLCVRQKVFRKCKRVTVYSCAKLEAAWQTTFQLVNGHFRKRICHEITSEDPFSNWSIHASATTEVNIHKTQLRYIYEYDWRACETPTFQVVNYVFVEIPLLPSINVFVVYVLCKNVQQASTEDNQKISS